MKYFKNLPIITHLDPSGNQITVNNLLTRGYFLPSLLNNILLFYQYDLRDGDRPEEISYKYYNDIYSYWIVLYSNGIIDPQTQWPLTDQQFEIYLNDKYSSDANTAGMTVLQYVQETTKAYQQIITTYDSENLQKNVITIEIDEDTYNSLNPITQVFTLNGVEITKSVDRNIQTLYDYEVLTRQSKRKINILNSKYYNSVISQFQSLMGQ